MAIRILGLDDDNHAPMFISEKGDVFKNYCELVRFLSPSHCASYEVRMFGIVDEIPMTCGLADFERTEINQMFEYLEGVGEPPKDVHPDLIFELFWNSANRQRWW